MHPRERGDDAASDGARAARDARGGPRVIAPAALERRDRRMVARVFGDAFVDDPGWVSVGPNSQRRRWRYAMRICGAQVLTAERLGGRGLGTPDDGVPGGACVYFPTG